MLADTMRRANESKTVGALIRAADLEAQAEEQRERTARLAWVALVMQTVLFLLAGLLLCGGLWVRVIGERDVLPQAVYGVFERLFQPGGLLSGTAVWVCAIVVLLILPLVCAAYLTLCAEMSRRGRRNPPRRTR